MEYYGSTNQEVVSKPHDISKRKRCRAEHSARMQSTNARFEFLIILESLNRINHDEILCDVFHS